MTTVQSDWERGRVSVPKTEVVSGVGEGGRIKELHLAWNPLPTAVLRKSTDLTLLTDDDKDSSPSEVDHRCEMDWTGRRNQAGGASSILEKMESQRRTRWSPPR